MSCWPSSSKVISGSMVCVMDQEPRSVSRDQYSIHRVLLGFLSSIKHHAKGFQRCIKSMVMNNVDFILQAIEAIRGFIADK